MFEECSGGIMKQDVLFIDELSSLLASASSATDLCRKLVHSDLTNESTTGASIFSIDQQAHFQLVGSYGKGLPVSGVSVWDEHPFGTAARSGKLHNTTTQAIDGSDVEAYCIPLTKGSDPIGILCLTLSAGAEMDTLSPQALSVVSKVTGIWLDSLGINSGSMGSGAQNTSAPSPESLTERQLNVLRLMAEGKTNSQIAQDLILSESTIRQETVKIYRALGVHARSEAGKRAKHLGIIDRLAI
jgi:DNA-binding CsgD family transcriptional regulator